MDEMEHELERLDGGGEAWQDTDAVVEVSVKRPLDTVVPVRLSADTWAELGQRARERGIGPSTLIRMWVLEKLREASGARRSA